MKDLLARLEELETLRFIHEMKDHWNQEDFNYDNKLAQEIKNIKANLKALGWEG